MLWKDEGLKPTGYEVSQIQDSRLKEKKNDLAAGIQLVAFWQNQEQQAHSSRVLCRVPEAPDLRSHVLASVKFSNLSFRLSLKAGDFSQYILSIILAYQMPNNSAK